MGSIYKKLDFLAVQRINTHLKNVFRLLDCYLLIWLPDKKPGQIFSFRRTNYNLSFCQVNYETSAKNYETLFFAEFEAMY